MCYSPLEQFDILPLISLQILNLDISFTNSSLFLIIVLLLGIYSFRIIYYKKTLIPNRWQLIFEMFYNLILSLALDNIGNKGRTFFPFIFSLFFVLLLCNLIGLIPYSFTVTSHICITFFLSFSIFIAMNIIGFKLHGIRFFSFFLPAGTPFVMVPVLVLIELLSYLSRPFSLAIRLFANMMSGHCLLKIIGSFVFKMICAGGVFYIIQVIPFALLLAFTGLELGIAFLQAYVFTILVCIYLNDVLDLHH